MITVSVTAHCIRRCQWAARPGDWATVDKQAEAHTRTAKHPTGTEATPPTATMAEDGHHATVTTPAGR